LFVVVVDVCDGCELEELVDVVVVECAGLSGDGVGGGRGESLDDGVGPWLFVVAGVEDAGEECVARSDGGVDASWVDEDSSDDFVVWSDVDDAFGAARGDDMCNGAAVPRGEFACGVNGLLFVLGGLAGESFEFAVVELGHPDGVFAECFEDFGGGVDGGVCAVVVAGVEYGADIASGDARGDGAADADDGVFACEH